jgi:hypothetical protein
VLVFCLILWLDSVVADICGMALDVSTILEMNLLVVMFSIVFLSTLRNFNRIRKYL